MSDTPTPPSPETAPVEKTDAVTPVAETHVQPLINRRMIRRGIFGVIVIVVALIVIYFVQTVRDVDLPPTADTVGWLAAVQQTQTGSQVVMIKPDGTIVPSKDYIDGEHDRDPVWRPDGNRLFFVSDRTDKRKDTPTTKGVNVFRWNPGSGKIERRTSTQGSYTNLIYSKEEAKGLGLVALGGVIVQFDPVTGDTAPVLPPAPKDQAGGAEGGRVSTIEGSGFSQYGNSFKSAAWFGRDTYKDRFVVAIMKGDADETLLLQDMTVGPNGLPPAIPLARGDRIDMDASRANGVIVFTLQRFKFPDPDHIPPESIQNGKVVAPVQHMVALLDPKTLAPAGTSNTLVVAPVPVAGSMNDQNVFALPVLSPDGKNVVVSVGIYKSGEMVAKGLLGMPAVPGGGNNTVPIHPGAVTGLSFSGDGKQIAYTQREPDGTQSVHVMDTDGKNDKALTAGKGSFSQARFSPQVK